MRRTERTETRTKELEGGNTMRTERQEAEELVTKRFYTSSVRLVGREVTKAIAKAQMNSVKKFFGNQFEKLATEIIDEVMEQVTDAVFTEFSKISRHYDNVIKNFLVEKYLENGDPNKYLVEFFQMNLVISNAMADAYSKAEKEFWTWQNLERWERIHCNSQAERTTAEGVALAVFDTMHRELAQAIGEMEVHLSEAQRDVGYFSKEEGR
jgi:hypothetical protein